MRKALNENPMVQIAVLAIGAIAFGLILLTSMGGGGSDSGSSDTAAAPSSVTTPADGSAGEIPGAPATPSTPSAPAPGAATPAPQTTPPPAQSAEPPASGGAQSADGMLPSKGLPQDVLIAYAKGDAIALLVTNPRSLSDPQMKSAVRHLQRRDDVTTFVVESDRIAKYSRITAGVSVSRVPALVVIRPRKLTDNVPTASVSYGFRGADSVEQAVDDALYDGRRRGIHP